MPLLRPTPPNYDPRPGIQLLQGGGLLDGYPGPWPGSPEFQAAIMAGQHPVKDWLMAQRQQRASVRPDRIDGIGALGDGPHTMAPPALSTTGYGADPMARRRPTPIIAR